jgi:hypothetical protein
MVENRTKIGKLFVSFYLNGGSKNLILANGIPSYVTKHHPLVRFCKENFINLFIPRYYGSFESEGDFSLKNSTTSIEECVKLVSSGKTIELFYQKEISWNPSEVFLLGFSFGALPVLNSNVPSNVKKILNSPFINLNLNEQNNGPAKGELYYVERAYPNLFRFKTEKLIEEYQNLSYPLDSNFILIQGKLDDTISKQEIEFIQKMYSPKTILFEGGHTIDLESLKPLLIE